MTKKVVISGYYGYDNFGDEAILSVLIDYLKQKNCEITVLSHNPQKTSKNYAINSVKNFNLLSVFFTLLNSNILISGGGSLLQDVTSKKSLMYYSLIIFLAQLLGKKVIIFAQGIGPLLSNFSKNLVLNLLKKCSLVTVRDTNSLNLLLNNDIQAILVSDPVFSVDLPKGEQTNAVGIQLRDFKSLDDKFLFNLAQYVVLNFGDRPIELYVFQHALDFEICKKFEKMLKTIYPQIQTKIIHSISQNDIIVKISSLEYMIAMRFHAVLVAIKTGVKTLAINYDAKVAALAYDSYLPLLTLDSEQDFEVPFERLKELNADDLLKYANSQHFEWEYFNEFFDN